VGGRVSSAGAQAIRGGGGWAGIESDEEQTKKIIGGESFLGSHPKKRKQKNNGMGKKKATSMQRKENHGWKIESYL